MIPTPIAAVAQESAQTTQIARALRGRFKTVALQSRVATDASIQAFKEAGLVVMEWDRVDANTKKHAGSAQINLQIESASQLTDVIGFLPKVAGQTISIGTTYGGLDTPDGSAWKKLAAACMSQGVSIERVWVECYKADDPVHADLPRMLNQGGVYGIPGSLLFPLVGTYRGESPSDYPGLDSRAGDFGIYILEQTTDDALVKFAALVPLVPSPAVLNAQIVQLCDSWLTLQTGPQTKSRLRNIRRIAATSGNDAVWLAAQPGVTAALDEAGA